jgi:hypothetical protein
MTYGTVNVDSLVSSDGGVIGPNITSLRNRIINGAMVIDQRNAGASVTVAAGGSVYTADRWGTVRATAGSYAVQQSTTAPSGFYNSLYFYNNTANTPASGDYNFFYQQVEGLNVADLGWGTASAQSVTISFQARASATGTYGGSLRNSAGNRSYPFTFVINAVDTFETKTVTIAGDTSGTWLKTNGIGIGLCFDLGSGSSFRSTAGAWASGNYVGATGTSQNMTLTSGATFYITGVQLEKGSTATSFDYRPYGTELALCQRYLPAYTREGNDSFAWGQCTSATAGTFFIPWQVTPRVNPTGVVVSNAASFYVVNATAANAFTVSAITLGTQSKSSGGLNVTYANNGGSAGQANILLANAAGAYIYFTGCEL